MPLSSIPLDELRGVFAVPPLPRRPDPRRTIDFDAAERVVAHIERGGISRFLYGGNAFLYHVSLEEYECLIGWLSGCAASRWVIPGIGPSFGRAIDQARILRRHHFRCAMALPCSDPRDARGIEAGLHEAAGAAGLPLILYLKSEDAFGSDRTAGLDAIARLMNSGDAVAIKYAIVRADPSQDAYLGELLQRVDAARVLSGIGERPAIAHLKRFGLGGMTTGSGCLAPRLCRSFFEACQSGDWSRAEEIRRVFLPLEDLRDAWGPARVLHHAVELSGIARTGPIPPFVSALEGDRPEQLRHVCRALLEAEP